MKPRNLMIPLLIALTPLLMAYDCGDFPRESPSTEANVQRWPAWSPDGARIAFNYGDSIYVVESDGSRLQPISDPPPDAKWYADFSPDISPDGSRVAFGTTRHKVGTLEIGTSALDGSDYRRLTDNEGWNINPAWSPDGTRIAFVSGQGIAMMSADGSDLRIVTPPSVSSTKDPPVWSPGGRRMVFLGYEGELGNSRQGLYTITTDGTDLRKISSEMTSQPTWSPDGTRIAFAVSEDELARIYTVRPDGSDLQEVTKPDQSAVVSGSDSPPRYYNVSNLSWSLDGFEIWFDGQRSSRTSDGEEALEGSIHAVNVDGPGSRTIVDTSGLTRSARSPDGSRIAVRDRGHGTSGVVLYTIAADGSDMRVLVRGGEVGLVAENSAWQDASDDIRACSQGFVVPDPKKNQGLVQDCETLLSIRNTLAGEDIVLGWGADTPIANWFGVNVWGDPPRVRSLSLPFELAGTIPGDLGKLAELEKLKLGRRLTGSIPPELANLSKLWLLHLHENNLTGEIPPDLGNLAKLEWLALSKNRLTGEIPPELGKLANLEELVLDHNNFTGSIPPELGNLVNLESLTLGDNILTGSIPPELGGLALLRTLDLGANALTGSVPPELGGLALLHSLDLGANALTGSVPPELADLTNLSQIDLSGNSLTGCIPSEVFALFERPPQTIPTDGLATDVVTTWELRTFNHDGLEPC